MLWFGHWAQHVICSSLWFLAATEKLKHMNFQRLGLLHWTHQEYVNETGKQGAMLFFGLSLWTEAFVMGEGRVAPTLRAAVSTWDESCRGSQPSYCNLQKTAAHSNNSLSQEQKNTFHCLPCPHSRSHNLPFVNKAVIAQRRVKIHNSLVKKQIHHPTEAIQVNNWLVFDKTKTKNTLTAIKNYR